MLLKGPLGRSFYRQKKYPYPVDLSEFENEDGSLKIAELEKNLKQLLERSTYFVQGNGPEYSLKVARLIKGKQNEIVSNIEQSLEKLIDELKVRGIGEEGIRRISIKGENTESLPVYNYLTVEEKNIMRELINQK